jgi:anti-sigma regulatory factor (Ser/Thr protein kinase)
MKQLTVPAQIVFLEEVLDFTENKARDAGLDAKQLLNVGIAVEEIFVNITSYAYPSNTSLASEASLAKLCNGEVTISVFVDSGRFIIEFTDTGMPYDPLAKDDPDTTQTAEEREIGGLGIFMVKNLMDDVRYRYEDGKNILTIYKDINTINDDGNKP